MDANQARRRAQEGLTLIEIVIVAAILVVLIGGAVSATVGIQTTFAESQIVSYMTLRAQHAMERMVTVASQAVTSDPMYGPLKPTTGVDSKVLRLRLIQSMAGGVATYDDNLRIYICGVDDTTYPCAGVVIGRGPSLSSIYAAGKGADDLLGTRDDDTTAAATGTTPAVELLLHERFAPSTGDMLTFDVDTLGRLITITLRVNSLGADGNFVLPTDLVIQERVALLQ